MKPSPYKIMIPAVIAIGAMMPAIAGAQATPRQYTLFEGANIAVNLDKSIYPVRDVDGSSWVVDINGQDKVISARQAPINLKITPSLKLTEVSATIEGFKREGGYTFANDPAVRLTRGMSAAAGVNAGYHAAASQANAVNPTLMNTASAGGKGGNNDPLAQDSAGDAAQSATAGADASVGLEQRTDSGGGFDTINVEFEISSAKPLEDPYIVTMTRFHPRGSEPGTVQSLVYAKALEPVGVHPSKVKFTEEGFPVDYEVVDFQLHLYNHGVEIATNIADKREEMSPEQAFQYVKGIYLKDHKDDTLAAVPVMGELPADLAEHLASGKYSDVVYVKVSKDGLADEAFADAACTKKIDDAYLETVIRSLRFKPALEQGKPVEGVSTLKLAQLRT